LCIHTYKLRQDLIYGSPRKAVKPKRNENDRLRDHQQVIFLTPSVASKPVIRTTGKKGIGLSITGAFGMSHIADALQEQAGYP
jgi:hypothetical protein